jgi:sensor histidine kinase regulating citrate/malate metabolism
MSRKVQLQLFQRSFSTKGKNRGLGTYSMKLLSERYLQGSISFKVSEKEGTTFFARYPLNLHAKH